MNKHLKSFLLWGVFFLLVSFFSIRNSIVDTYQTLQISWTEIQRMESYRRLIASQINSELRSDNLAKIDKAIRESSSDTLQHQVNIYNEYESELQKVLSTYASSTNPNRFKVLELLTGQNQKFIEETLRFNSNVSFYNELFSNYFFHSVNLFFHYPTNIPVFFPRSLTENLTYPDSIELKL